MNNNSPPAAKIALFRRLFRGRDDVYPRRFESRKTGRSGYQPACANEWVKGLCDKGRVKCVECPNRRFLPVSDEIIRNHLSGQDDTGCDWVMGVYPMLLDETCFLLAVDFDKEHWREDIAAYRETCRRLDIPAVLERSRSGNGGHVWLFFAEPVPAALARRLASHLLTETMEQRPDIGLDSYDRFIPNQDTLPHGGLGNLIALPLQKKARAQGNSLFLDDDLVPHADQWAFLASVNKISPARAQEIVRNAEAGDRIIGVRLAPEDEGHPAPWSALPSRRRKDPPLTDLPESMDLVLGDQLYIPKEKLAPGLRNRLLRLAAFQNPEFYKAQAMRLSTFGKSRIIACAEDYPLHIGLPRGCLDEARELLSALKVRTTIHDERFRGIPLKTAFRGELRPAQLIAAEAMAAHESGVLSATTAFGKTVIAAWLIAKRGVNTLVLVHRRQLLEQWAERLATFLDLPEGAIGRIGGGRREATGMVDVAVIQSLVRKGVVDDLLGDYGHIVVDECHHLSAHSFELAARRAQARFVIGLSSTVVRKDGHHPIIFMQCGPVRHRVEPKKEALIRPFSYNVLVRPTAFQPLPEAKANDRIPLYQLYSELIGDEARNHLLCEDVVRAIGEGRSPVVLTERTEHLELLAQRLSSRVRHLIILRGGMGRKKLRAALTTLAAVPKDEERLLLATGRYIGEGFDDARLDTLFLALPVSWRGTIAQYAGRLHRLYKHKHEVRIYDYADLNVPMLARMFERRCRGYEAVGYTVHLPASGVPGWPAEVDLPIDPLWKQDYAASLRRLIRDGVDQPLAALFAEVSLVPTTGAEGAGHARSASEAFLFRRLESLPLTSGRFRLNRELPIPFDGMGKMEVDLLDIGTRIAIEIDGPQHLDDPDAYRRDRRKDRLLQENGYLVLRFLAEDIGKRLDEVLDSIARALANRWRKHGG
ncbi:MAG: TOTE conflict system archaeo-eukaryotic primase domain-containing protein [Desulfobulbaceae bacterium]